MNLFAIFLTGLTTGGLSCLAMQGGLIASFISNQKHTEIVSEERKKFSPFAVDRGDWLPVGLFLLSKFAAHVVLGYFLGWIGSAVEISLTVRLIFQVLAALFMLATVGNLLQIHPVFRYVIFQPPGFIRRWLKRVKSEETTFTPLVLGIATIFIPCGVTQAMEVTAVASGSPLAGAMILGTFVVGTTPLFALVGVATAKLSEVYARSFMKLAAILLLLLAVNSVNGVLVVLDSPITLQRMSKFFSEERFAIGETIKTSRDANGNEVQKVQIVATNDGYLPNRIRVAAGIPVELSVSTVNNYTCASYFYFKEFGIRLQLGPTDSKTVRFTPTKKGSYQFTCAMGMYTGIMEVL